MKKPKGVAGAKARAVRDEQRAIGKIAKQRGNRRATVKDSYQNFVLNLGMGTNNALAASTYGFNPITRVRTLLEWMHRGSWLAGVAIDIIADDMTKSGVELLGTLKPEDIEVLDQEAVMLNLWGKIGEVIKWARLYGGALGVMMIDGQDMRTPLNADRIGRDQFKGLAVLDRWMVEPTLNSVVQTMGPHMGLPEFYRVNADAPALHGKVIHYSRCLRMVGIKLPYWQSVMENLWGISVLERLYDRMVAFDSATQGAAQLVYKSFLRTYKVEKMRDILAMGGPGALILQRFVDMMARFQSIEGVTLIDAKDDFAVSQSNVNAGISDVLEQLGDQVCGALETPRCRLFGQSPGGMQSNGESELTTYYDGLKQKQVRDLQVPVLTMYRIMAKSKGIALDNKFNIAFRPMWQMSDSQKSEVDNRDTTTVLSAEGQSLISPQTALQELKQRGKATGRWTNITEKMIKEADDEVAPRLDMEGGEGIGGAPGEGGTGGDEGQGKKPGKTEDKIPPFEFHGVPVIIEADAGKPRWDGGPVLPAPYGYIRRTEGADGDEMDCMIGGDRPQAFVFNMNRGGQFDEHKIMLGYDTEALAAMDLLAAYRGTDMKPSSSVQMSVPELVQWLTVANLKGPVTKDHKRAPTVQ